VVVVCESSLDSSFSSQSLSGLTSSVECVSFDANEELVLAGSQGGSLKIFDLAASKQIRTLTGHMSSCTCADFHPYGEFMASGSLDTNLKVWDIRHKSCIQTYKGHQREITCVCFSPDGRWVLSGGKDGAIKLWDLTAGKLMHDFTKHSGAISAMHFNPDEFLLATTSADRTVKFWDLENFNLVSSTPVDSSDTKRVTFASGGASGDKQVLLAGSSECLKVWGWEPVQCLDTVEVGWGNIGDMHVIGGNSAEGGDGAPEQQLVSVSMHSSFVQVWVVELPLVRPFSSPDDDEPYCDRRGVESQIETRQGSANHRQQPAAPQYKVPAPTTTPPRRRMTPRGAREGSSRGVSRDGRDGSRGASRDGRDGSRGVSRDGRDGSRGASRDGRDGSRGVSRDGRDGSRGASRDGSRETVGHRGSANKRGGGDESGHQGSSAKWRGGGDGDSIFAAQRDHGREESSGSGSNYRSPRQPMDYDGGRAGLGDKPEYSDAGTCTHVPPAVRARARGGSPAASPQRRNSRSTSSTSSGYREAGFNIDSIHGSRSNNVLLADELVPSKRDKPVGLDFHQFMPAEGAATDANSIGEVNMETKEEVRMKEVHMLGRVVEGSGLFVEVLRKKRIEVQVRIATQPSPNTALLLRYMLLLSLRYMLLILCTPFAGDSRLLVQGRC
jgi:hypothetical protein